MPRLPLRVALTGGIATGKSHCLMRFAALGADVIDADQLARQVVTPGTPGMAAVLARFGQTVMLPDGTLDREALGRLVFADLAARRDLEAIIHPAVFAAIDDWFEKRPRRSFYDSRKMTSEVIPVAIADIPLLYETQHEGDFDRVIVAACTPAQQLERLKKRGLADADARLRLESQLPIDEKARRADYVIDTSGSVAETDRQVAEVWESLRRAAAM